MRPHLYLDLNLNLNLNLCLNLDLFLFQKPFQKLSEASFDSSVGFKQPQLKGLAYLAVYR